RRRAGAMTHAYLGLAAFDLCAVAVGYAVLSCLGFVRRPGQVLRHLGLAFLTGWALLGVAVATAVTEGVDPRAGQVLILALVAIAVCVGAQRLFPALERQPRPREREPLLRAAALAGGALLLVAVVGTLTFAARAGADGSWDVWAFWLPKAEATFYFHGLDTGLGGFLTYANPEYPPLVPATTAATFHFMGGVHPALLPLQQSLLGVAFLASVVVLLAPRVPRWI